MLYQAEGRRGSADLCAYFFLRAGQLVRAGGNFGLLAVNTIAEGDTRQVGLEPMLKSGFAIYAATPNFPWPGAAAVAASAVHVHRGPWAGGYRLSGKDAPTISAFLSSEDEWSPKPLKANANKSFQGSIVLGMGFTMSEEKAQSLIALDAKNSEVLFPYLNGEDLNSHPEQKPSRWVINFWDWPLARDAKGSWGEADQEQQVRWLRDGHVPADYPDRAAADFPEVLAIVERDVKPERDANNRSVYREKWWHFAEKRPALYHAIGRGHMFARHPDQWDGASETSPQILACARVSKFWCPTFVVNSSVASEATVVFSTDSLSTFAILQSSVHGEWARKMASSLESRLRYTPSDIFETFPFPDFNHEAFTQIGRHLYQLRAAFMIENSFGLTDFYNRFHKSDFDDAGMQVLREVWMEVDSAVAQSYGWQDIVLGHAFQAVAYLPKNDCIRFAIREDARLEILRRLAQLNRARWLAEQARETSENAITKAQKQRGKAQLSVIQGGLL